jgi:hypothetical protein
MAAGPANRPFCLLECLAWFCAGACLNCTKREWPLRGAGFVQRFCCLFVGCTAVACSCVLLATGPLCVSCCCCIAAGRFADDLLRSVSEEQPSLHCGRLAVWPLLSRSAFATPRSLMASAYGYRILNASATSRTRMCSTARCGSVRLLCPQRLNHAGSMMLFTLHLLPVPVPVPPPLLPHQIQLPPPPAPQSASGRGGRAGGKAGRPAHASVDQRPGPHLGLQPLDRLPRRLQLVGHGLALLPQRLELGRRGAAQRSLDVAARRRGGRAAAAVGKDPTSTVRIGRGTCTHSTADFGLSGSS